MDPRPNESSACLVKSGEDSGEFTMTQNALSPLSDILLSDGLGLAHSSPKNYDAPQIPQLELIARPPLLDDLDFNEGFSYGLPIKFTPGQLSRPKPAKSSQMVEEVQGGTSAGSHIKANKKQSNDLIVAPDTQLVNAHLTSQPSLQRERVQDRQSSRDPGYLKLASALAQQKALDADKHQIEGVVDAPAESGRAHISHNRPPFADYQPLCRQANDGQSPPLSKSSAPHALCSNTQVSTVRPKAKAHPNLSSQSQTQEIPSVHLHALSGQHQLDQRQVQRQLPEKHAVLTSAQKPRTSLPNDISITLAHPPRRLSQNVSPRRPVASRPFRDGRGQSFDLDTPSSRCKASSIVVGSNTKKRRETKPSTSSSHCSPNHPRLYDGDAVSLIQSRKRTPRSPLRHFHSKLETTMGDLAGCLNDKFGDIKHDVNQHFEKIAKLKRTIRQQKEEVSRYKKETSDKDVLIRELQDEQQRLREKLDCAEQERQAQSDKVLQLKEKSAGFMKFLNKALEEQQGLYKATQERCDGTILQMRAEESQRNIERERKFQKAEAVRIQLNQLVKSTVAECSRKEKEYNDVVASLEQKVQEREADLLRERKTSTSLLQQTASISTVEDILHRFETQIEDVISKINDFASRQPQEDSQTASEMHDKLDMVVKHLRSQDERARSEADILGQLRELHEKAVTSITGSLEAIVASQLETKENMSSMCSGLDEYVGDLWEAIDERQHAIEQYALQRQDEDVQRRIEALEVEVHERESDCANQSRLLLESEANARQHEDLIIQLRSEIDDLERAQATSLQHSENTNLLRERCNQLKDEAAVKACLVSELQKEHATSLANGKKHEEEAERLRSLLEQHVAESKAMQKQVVETAQHEAMIRLDQLKADLEKQLGQALEEQRVLNIEISGMQQKIKELTEGAAKDSEKIADLEAELQTARKEATRNKEETNHDGKEKNVVRQQLLKLQAQLIMADQRFTNLADNAKAYDTAAKVVLRNLKQWTQKCAAIQKMASELSQTKDRGFDHIDPRFKPLIQLQLLQKAVVQYCLTPGRSSLPVMDDQGRRSRFFLDNLMDVRRVTVRSPSSDAPSPDPPSVQTEQERRRVAEPRRSIMKPNVPPSLQFTVEDKKSPLEALGHEGCARSEHQGPHDATPDKTLDAGTTRRNGALHRGPYNRLVAGSKPGPPHPVGASSRRSLLNVNTSRIGVVELGDMHLTMALETRKRKGSTSSEQSTQETETPKKKAKHTLQSVDPAFLTVYSSSVECLQASDAHLTSHVPHPANEDLQDLSTQASHVLQDVRQHHTGTDNADEIKGSASAGQL